MWNLTVKDTVITLSPKRYTAPRPPADKAQESERFKGVLSPRTRSKIRGILFAWHNARLTHTKQRYGLIAITLTLSSAQKHSDKEVKSLMLNQFLTELRTAHGCRNYYWVAEAQENGSIHFHVLIDQFLDKNTLTAIWNRIQQKAGYIPAGADTSNKSYPSTQIEKVKNAANMATYVSKYLTKQEEGKRKIEGRLWSCSREIANLGNCRVEITDEEAAQICDSVADSDIVQIEDTDVKVILPKARKQLIKNYSIIKSALREWAGMNAAYLYDKNLFYELYEICTSAPKESFCYEPPPACAPADAVCPF